MYIPLSDDKHRFVRESIICALEIQDNILVNFFSYNFFSDNFFSDKKSLFLRLFLRLNFVSDQILSRTEFFLRFCLGLQTAVVFRKQSFNLHLSANLSHLMTNIKLIWC